MNECANACLGAVHILRQPPEGGGGVSQKLTIADKGGRGGKPNADNCWQGGYGYERFSTKGFYVIKNVDR